MPCPLFDNGAHSKKASLGRGRWLGRQAETEGETDHFPPPVTAFSGDSPLV